MSATACRWARKQKTGGSGRKAVLMMLAILADRHGELQASLGEIASACEMSEGVARWHLDALEAAGLIARTEAYREDGGRAANKIKLPCKRPRRSGAGAAVEIGTAVAAHGWGQA